MRNIAALIDAATELIDETGDFNMSAVAKRAGIGRVTLYAHFPTREDLLAAAVQRAVEQFDSTLADMRLDDGAATAALERLVEQSWEMLDHHRKLAECALGALPPEEVHILHDPIRSRLTTLIKRGQRSGEFRKEFTPEWIVTMIITTAHATVTEVEAGRLRLKNAPALYRSTVLALIRPDGKKAQRQR